MQAEQRSGSESQPSCSFWDDLSNVSPVVSLSERQFLLPKWVSKKYVDHALGSKGSGHPVGSKGSSLVGSGGSKYLVGSEGSRQLVGSEDPDI